MKVSELQGAGLDCWVSRANGNKAKISNDGTFAISKDSRYSPSSDWRFGGPIIEREKMAVEPVTENVWMAEKWVGAEGTREDKFVSTVGRTPLEAAMRCFVESKFGPDVAD